MKKILFSRKSIIVYGILIAVAALVVGTISYITLRRLTFAGPDVVDEVREKANIKAVEIREHLLEDHDARLVHFDSRDGTALSGLFIHNPKAEVNVVACHGYRSNKEAMHHFIDIFPPANFLLFDFRGHGQSEGDFVTIGYHEYQDVTAACACAKELVNDTKAAKLPLVIMGVSMGAASALKAAALEPDICDALIVDSSYADLWEVVGLAFGQHAGLPLFPFLPVMEWMLHYFSGSYMRTMKPVEYVKTINKPIFFIHSTHDVHTDPKDTLRLYADAASEKTKIWIGPKTVHAKLSRTHAQTYKRKIRVFLNRHVHGIWK